VTEQQPAGLPIKLPSGATWVLEDTIRKLSLRAGLPGARVYDLCVLAQRSAAENGMSLEHRFTLALPASWLVNSPASSVVLRRWALEPARQAWLLLAEALSEPAHVFARGTWKDVAAKVWPQLGTEPFMVEAASKLLALLVPARVPLMPDAARKFVLGGEPAPDVEAFTAMIDFFVTAVAENEEDLAAVAEHHAEVPLTPAQVLDRLLWFDSEGHRHWKTPTG
jgi:hypothetical protein